MSDQGRIPQARGNQSASVRAVTWSLALVMFVAIYAAFSTDTSSSMYLGLAIAGAAMVIAVVVLTVLNVRQMRRFMGANNEAIGMLARGEHQRAYDVFWRLAEQARVPVVAAVARHNVACALVRQGKLQHAIEVYTHNDTTAARALRSAAQYPTSAADLALAHALAGNISDAEAWLARAAERASQPSQPSFPILCVYARAVVDCRTGKAADAARILDERWSVAEALLTGDNLRPLRVVRAFAHATADTRNAGIAESLLASARPVYAGEYLQLGAAWPEMATFLASHRLD